MYRAVEFDAFMQQLREDTICIAPVGCTDAELERVERVSGGRLPTAYRRFLGAMGRSAGRLFTHDHLDVTFEHACRLTPWVRQRIESSDDCDDDLLPARALVILGRLGAHFHFIDCAGGEDSTVHLVDLDEGTVVAISDSIMSWLQHWRTEALAAIRANYFDRDPGGGKP